jgi:hypothetical protein
MAINHEMKLKEEEDDTPMIESTTEYHSFKTLEGNRKISENHVRNLMDFVRKRNLLKYNPILVNGEYEVIDGQHRLEAAKQLQVPVYYIVGDGLSYKDAGVLNACSDDWEFREYLEMYLKNGHEEYIKLNEFKKAHNLKLKRFQYLMSKEQKQIFDESFKIGTFKIIDNLDEISDKLKKIETIITFLESVLLLDNKRFLYTDNFWRALYLFLIKKDIEIDIERFQEKLSVKYQCVRPMSGYKDYIKMFTDIYNWKRKESCRIK